MGHISQLFTAAQLVYAIEDGFVRARYHPLFPGLAILNYTEKAQYENHWNAVTRNCRGLIVEERSGQIIARGFPKFFNHTQEGAAEIHLDDPVQVSDKMDGSLGILYRQPDRQWAIATRGSFESEQALHATDLFRARYIDGIRPTATPFWRPNESYTYLFEIIYPGNRIVLDYGRFDDLVLLGAIDNATGMICGPEFDRAWPGPRAGVFEAPTLAAALAMPPRENAEGLVVRVRLGQRRGNMVKIKQEDYVRLHKLVTGLSERAVWEHLAEHQGEISGLLEQIPDEFHAWVLTVAAVLLEHYDALQGRAHAAYHEVWQRGFDDGTDIYGREFRKDFAKRVLEQHKDLAPYLFGLLDGKDIGPAIWKSLRPVGHRPMTHRTEDVA